MDNLGCGFSQLAVRTLMESALENSVTNQSELTSGFSSSENHAVTASVDGSTVRSATTTLVSTYTINSETHVASVQRPVPSLACSHAVYALD